jgi:2-polyprenyl-6-hydroxyphenyl methylase/3-demethylubiquinone-9 3-methyltransferase
MQGHFDSEEIKKFEAMAEEWWNPAGKFKPLHRLNPIRLDYIDSRATLKGAQVLDVGCGGGLLAEGLAYRGAITTGIDRSEKALAVARIHAEKTGAKVQYEISDAQTWATDHAGQYDVVTCMEVLEHVPDVPGTVAACAAMLKPGGYFFFATLNRTPQAYVKAILGAEYVLGWLPKGTHRYARFIRPSEINTACRTARLDVTDLHGMSYRMLTDRFELSDDLSVNYLGCAVKPV